MLLNDAPGQCLKDWVCQSAEVKTFCSPVDVLHSTVLDLYSAASWNGDAQECHMRLKCRSQSSAELYHTHRAAASRSTAASLERSNNAIVDLEKRRQWLTQAA